jgi:hypothetical protein
MLANVITTAATGDLVAQGTGNPKGVNVHTVQLNATTNATVTVRTGGATGRVIGHLYALAGTSYEWDPTGGLPGGVPVEDGVHATFDTGTGFITLAFTQ